MGRQKVMRRLTSECPCCGGASEYSFSAADWNQRTSNNKFKYFRCSDCLLTFIEQVPNELGRFYVNEQYDIPVNLNLFRPRAASQLWKVDLLKALIPGGSLFEIGPATGEFAYVARQAGYRPKLAEMDENCCRFLREVLKLDVVQTGNPADSFTSGDRYDAICIWQAIEHIPKFWELLGRAAGSLLGGGVLVVSTPNPRSLQARILGSYWPHIDAPRHLYLIPQDWFRSFALRHDLSVVMNSTRDVGSIGLNYYGWYLAVRNLTRGVFPERLVRGIAGCIAAVFRCREEAEGGGCSYTIAFRKS